MLLDPFQRALFGYVLDGDEFFYGGHPLPVLHIGEFHAFQTILVEFIEVDGQVQDPHEDGPLSMDRPMSGLRFEPSSDIGQSILGA